MLNPSALKPGQEQYEKFFSPTLKKDLYQYDYRHTDGSLFTTVAPSLKACRGRKDNWINKNV